MGRRAVVVGASLAGLRVAQELRRLGFDGSVDLIGAEPHLPYDRPPLSKALLLGDAEPADVALTSAGELADLDVTPMLGCAAEALDLAAREVVLEDEQRIGFDLLFIATGAAARAPRALWGLPGVHVLRTVDDALALRDAIGQRPRMVIVGAGFIGAEVAAAARHAGCEVTMVDAVEAPLAAVLGPEIAAACSLEHHQHGVRFIGGVTVEAVEGAGRVERVQLSDGRELDADLVLLGVGARPATDWLAGSGLALDDGVLCDETCRTGAPGVYAAGDVARFAHRGYGERIRIEHWANASEMATAAVAAALGDRTPFVPIPSFWSDQYGLRLQTLGRLRPDDVVEIVAGSPEDRRFLALYGRGGRLTGLLTLSWPLMLARHKTLLSSGASWAEALDAVRAPMAVPAAER